MHWNLTKEISKIIHSVIETITIDASVFGEARGARGGKGLEVPIKLVCSSDNRLELRTLDKRLKKKVYVEMITEDR